MNVGDLITNAGSAYPDRAAFIFEGERRTYGQSLQRVDDLCRGLCTLGAKAGDRIAIYMGNCPEFLEAMFAVWKLGAVAVPLDSSFTADELAWHLADSGSLIAFTDRDGVETMQKISTDAGLQHIVCLDAYHDFPAVLDFETLLRASAGARFRSVDVHPQDLAWLAYTSGTTGRPKGAMLSHRALVNQAVMGLADAERMERHHVGMHAAPLSHGSGYNALVFVMKACPQVIHQRRRFSPALFLDQVEKYRAAAMFLVPTQVKMIVDEQLSRPRDLSSLRWVMYGGAPMYRADQKRALEVLGKVLVQIFGQTESPMCGTVLAVDEHSVKYGDERTMSVARVRCGLELRIMDDDDREVPVGEPGQICLRGDTLMNGYWNRPEETRATLANGWLHTGDIGSVDERGYLYVLDHLEDLIITGGLNVYPHEVEDVLLTHPGISEACVVGVPDLTWGEAVHALVVATPDIAALGQDEIIAFTGQKLADFKKPKRVEFVEALPKTAYGKVAKREVRATYWSGMDRVL